jgi:DNA-binding transcriptional MerR regulator
MASKSRDAFRTISEVADWLDTPTHVLRFWESKFAQVKPVKRAGGRRYYRPADMELLGGIKKLLHEDGMTIKGVQKVLRESGVKHVASLSPALTTQTDDAKTDATKADVTVEAATTEVAENVAAPEATTPEEPIPLPQTAPRKVLEAPAPKDNLFAQGNLFDFDEDDGSNLFEDPPEAPSEAQVIPLRKPEDATETAPEAQTETPDTPASQPSTAPVPESEPAAAPAQPIILPEDPEDSQVLPRRSALAIALEMPREKRAALATLAPRITEIRDRLRAAK